MRTSVLCALIIILGVAAASVRQLRNFHETDHFLSARVQVAAPLEGPVLDTGIGAGDDYYIHGQSTQAQADAGSIRHGMLSATEPDQWAHIRGDLTPGLGDSGAGCFAVKTGKLVGMIVGADDVARTAVMIPAAVISAELARVRRPHSAQ